jgi:hypothetical protein
MRFKMQISKEVKYKDLVFVLFNTCEHTSMNKTANISAFTVSGRLVWVAEVPEFDNSYYTMQIDEDKGILEADGGSFARYEINVTIGKVVNVFRIK